MYRLPLNSYLLDFLLELTITALMFYSVFYAHSKIRLKLPRKVNYKVNIFKDVDKLNNYASLYTSLFTWFVVIFVTYILLKGLIYTGIYSTVTAEVVSAADRKTAIYSSSGRRGGGLGDAHIITVDSPIFQAEINGKIEQFEFERYFSSGEIEIGEEFTLVYINVWGIPSYVNYGGFYFFRHDFTCISLLFIILMITRVNGDRMDAKPKATTAVVESSMLTFHQCIGLASIAFFATQIPLIIVSWFF